MLFKEKVLLTNCDSVRNLGYEELRKRVLMGVVFADGVVLSMNMLLDSRYMLRILSAANIVRYFREDGAGKILVRGHGIEGLRGVSDYFDSLPDNFIVSSAGSGATKQSLKGEGLKFFTQRLKLLDELVNKLGIRFEAVEMKPDSLQVQIRQRWLKDDSVSSAASQPVDVQTRILTALESGNLVSRSDWYAAMEHWATEFGERFAKEQFRSEVVDPSYHYLFAQPGEGFMQDRVRFLDQIPPAILDTAATIRAMRRDIGHINTALNTFQLIHSLGATSIVSWLTERAREYIEDQFESTALSHLSRKNWYGMYPRMRRIIGLEIK